MRVVITLATTGQVLLDLTSGRFETMRGWQLREYFVRYIGGVYFEWIFIVQDAPMSETDHVHAKAATDPVTSGLTLQVQAIRREVTALTSVDMANLRPAIEQGDSTKLWAAMMNGRFVPRPSPRGRLLSNPLLMALRRNQERLLSMEEDIVSLPDPLYIFLLASCDPNEMSNGVSPLCQALRAGDAGPVSLLLKYRADPTQCELGHPDPIFIAIRSEFPRGVRLLIDHKANIDALQTYATSATGSGHSTEVILHSRTTFEAAAGCPRILLMLQDAKHNIKCSLA